LNEIIIMLQHAGGTALVKSSYDPRQDFKESMKEMMRARNLETAAQIVGLLCCYLALNSAPNHRTIVDAFNEVWCELFRVEPDRRNAF
jgi:uncharacterized protein (TIGR01568 family)